MQVIKTGFEGLFIIQHRILKDRRGQFVKTYSQEIFKDFGIDLEIKERYFSISNRNVIRGMHFQTPPEDHIKLVTVVSGQILDVVLDIRRKSPTFGKFFAIKIDSSEGYTIYIPQGFAHGFAALYDKTIVEYNQTTGYTPSNDAGIKFDSFGFEWNISKPIISERDNSFLDLDSFISPF